MTLTLNKKKGAVITVSEANTFVTNLVRKHNELSKSDIDNITTGQFTFLDAGGTATYDYYNYCGMQNVSILNCTASTARSAIIKPFSILSTKLKEALRKFEGGSY